MSIRSVSGGGVTPPSIYRHFADKTALIFEVVARHFRALEDHVGQACGGIDDPVERLTALGVAYIEFGIANPEPYRIMFLTAPDVVPPEYHGKVLADSAAFRMLVRCVQDAIDAGRLRPEYNDAYPTSLGLWARVHGLTSLGHQARPAVARRQRVHRQYAGSCLWGIVAGADSGRPNSWRGGLRLPLHLGDDHPGLVWCVRARVRVRPTDSGLGKDPRCSWQSM